MRKIILICFFLLMLPSVATAVDVSEFNSLNSKLSVLDELMEECCENGIPVHEEKINYTVIKDFITYGKNDIANGYDERAGYVLDCLNELYDEAFDNLNAYLTGEKKALGTVRYKSGDILRDKTSFLAERDDNSTGNIFFTGYMGDVENIDSKLIDLGTNIITLETGVWDVIVPSYANLYGGFEIKSSGESAKISREEGIGQNSSAGIRFSNTGGQVSLSKTIYVEPDTEYEIGCAGRNVSGGGILFTSDRTASAMIKNTSSRFSVSKLSFSSGANTSVTIEFLSETTGENIIDNVFVRKKGTSDNVLTGGDFEKDVVHREGYDIDSGALGEIIRSAKTAEKNDIFVNLLISPHYFPEFILSENEDYRHGGSGFGGGGVEWSEKRIQDVMCDYASAIGEMLDDCSAVKSVCLMNEPMFNLMYSNSDKVKSLWQEWLKNKYEDIGIVKDKHMAYYSSFSKIPVASSFSQSPFFYDWKQFNEEYFADFHKMLASEVKNNAPDIMIHTKMVDYMSRIDSDYEYKFMLSGTEANLFSEFSDLHGNDAHAYLEEHTYQLESKMLWYDYLTTVDEKPIFNSEDHIIMDKSKNYSENQAIHVACDLWQGALHGRSASTIWVYRRTYDEKSLVMDSILHRPDCIAAVGKTNIRLNRVADVMSRLQNTEPEIGVVFSTASRVYNRNYMNCLYKAYQAANYSGYRVSVLDDKALKAGKAEECRLLILPDTKYIEGDSVSAIADYVKNGGKIIALGDSCLRYDEYKKGISSTLKSGILDDAIRFSTDYMRYELVSPTSDEILEAVRNLAPNEVRITDSATGEDLSDTEYRWIDEGDGKILNICRYSWSDPTEVEIYIDGKKVPFVYDLVNETELDKVTVSGYTPVLIYADTRAFAKVENGSIYAENADASDVLIQALYSVDGRLLRCNITDASESMQLFNKEEGQIIKIMIWDKQMKPLSVVSDF